jgi:hypothetical protein
MAQTSEYFEFAGKTFLAEGTSGSPKVPVQQATGRPVRGDLTVGGRAMLTTGTSGPHPSPAQIAPGRPMRAGSVSGFSSAGGTHVAVGTPTRIS